MLRDSEQPVTANIFVIRILFREEFQIHRFIIYSILGVIQGGW